MHTFVRGNTLLLLFGDILVFLGALLATLAIRYREVPSQDIIDQHLAPFLFVFCIWSIVYWISGLYDRRLFFARKRITGLVFKIQFINILIAGVLFFAIPFGIEPKTNLVIYLLVSTACIALWRLFIYPRLVTSAETHVLVIGNSPEAREIIAVFERSPYYQNVRMSAIGSASHSPESLRARLLQVVTDGPIDMIIADTHDSNIATLTQDFYSLVFSDQEIKFFNLSAMYEQLHNRIPPSLVRETWFLENVTTQTPHYAYDVLKRSIDIVGALILLIITAVLFPFIALAIKLNDGGPLIYKTERIGQFSKPFALLKFRTMTGMDVGDSALKSAHSVTRVGAFLRKTRLDELPQLINILKGDLSFIGPRPEMPALVSVYAETIPYYNLRHLIKPGLSGWAQINHYDVPRAGVDVERTIAKLSFDLYYLKHRSFFLDIEIALKTIATLLMRVGT